MKLKEATLTVCQTETIHRIPGTWTAKHFISLLKVLEVEDIESYKEEELEEVSIMALQDLEHLESVKVILTTLFDNQFTLGQIQNLVEELKEDNAWDEYSDLADHKALYVCLDLLSSVFPEEYPKPSLKHISIEIKHQELDDTLGKHPINEVSMLRSIAKIEEEKSILNRLFPEQIKGGEFPEANHILWLMTSKSIDPNTQIVNCYGSSFWLKDITKNTEVAADIILS